MNIQNDGKKSIPLNIQFYKQVIRFIKYYTDDVIPRRSQISPTNYVKNVSHVPENFDV